MADVRRCANWQEVVNLYEERARDMLNGDSQGFKDWLMTKQLIVRNNPFFGAKTCAVAYNIYKKIKVRSKSSDHFTVVCGLEGVGKSTFGAQFGAMVSPTLKRASILYEPSDFLQQVLDSEEGDTLVLDEGVLFLFTRSALTKNNVEVTKIFQLMRVKRLHIVICIPRFKNIDSEVRQHRCDTLIQYRSVGNYRVFTRKGIQYLINFYPKVKNNIFDVRVKQSEWFDDYNNMDFPVINDLNWDSYQADKRANFEREVNEAIIKLKRTEEGKKEALISNGGEFDV